MKKSIGIVLLFIILYSTHTNASDETWLHLGMLSHHLSSKNYNERHRLIGIDHNDWYVGYYNNSYDKDSFFIFRNYDVNSFDNYLSDSSKLKLRVGVISGYSHIVGNTMPAIIPTLSFNYEPVSFDINVLLKVFSIEFKVKIR